MWRDAESRVAAEARPYGVAPVTTGYLVANRPALSENNARLNSLPSIPKGTTDDRE